MLPVEEHRVEERPSGGVRSRSRSALARPVAAAGLLVATWLLVSRTTALAVAGCLLVMLVMVRSFRSRAFRRRALRALAVVLPLAIAGIALRTWLRYRTADVMDVAIREFSVAEYPEDPADRSVLFGMYQGRRLRLVRKDATHFDFVFEPLHRHVATVTFKNVDASLMTPSLPSWTKNDSGLLRIALTDRQWNRQQVRFGGLQDGRVEVSGGNGLEAARLHSAELAKNCLNAGLWEVLLFVNEDGQKKLYYQGWFTFPLGIYRQIFQHNTGLPYASHWYYLEHWLDPAGTVVPLAKLRRVLSEHEVPTQFNPREGILASGEQVRKRRTTMADNVVSWGDFFRPNDIHFATFIPPGRYSVARPWSNEYPRITHFERAILRQVRSPARSESVDELELVFSAGPGTEKLRYFVSGFQVADLPQLSIVDYPKGLYMPMGIGVPPFFQDVAQLHEQPPDKTPYFSVLLDERDRWVDHHRFAIDGPVMHRDAENPRRLHVYLLSYERHSLIGHWIVDLDAASERSATAATPLKTNDR